MTGWSLALLMVAAFLAGMCVMFFWFLAAMNWVLSRETE